MINGDLTVFRFFKMVGVGVAGIGAIVIVLSTLGFGIQTPSQNLSEFKTIHSVEHKEIDSTIVNINVHMNEQMRLTEALVAGQCLESNYIKLARQRILDTCKDLGIERKSNDAIDRELLRQQR